MNTKSLLLLLYCASQFPSSSILPTERIVSVKVNHMIWIVAGELQRTIGSLFLILLWPFYMQDFSQFRRGMVDLTNAAII